MRYLTFVIAVLLSACATAKKESVQNIRPTNGNPVVPGYFADPSIFRDDDGTCYIYATTDGYDVGKFTNGPFGVWKSKDFRNWEFFNYPYPDAFPYWSEKHWAPSVTKGPDGRYYMYFVKDGYDCFVVSAESPLGPWKEENAGKPVAPEMFDAEVFKDDDGSYYLVYQGPKKEGKYSIWMGKLKPNMIEFDGEPRMVYQNFDLFEGPGMFKRDGIYYMLYSNGSLSGSYHVNVAYSKGSVWGPYTPHNVKGGPYEPVIKPIPEQNLISTGHNSVLDMDTAYYMVYHRKADPYRKGSDLYRQVAVERLKFDKNGRMISVKPTFKGVNPLGGPLAVDGNLALDKPVKASSVASPVFGPEGVTDQDYRTMWRAAENTYPQTLEIDLGEKKSLKEVRIFFEYMTERYFYRIDCSEDGKEWKLFDDKTKKAELKAPAVSKGRAKARFVKLTITGSTKKNKAPGVWEVFCR
ncbi:family 43 glycosylhydrolase [Fulvitalea axinellae]